MFYIFHIQRTDNYVRCEFTQGEGIILFMFHSDKIIHHIRFFLSPVPTLNINFTFGDKVGFLSCNLNVKETVWKRLERLIM